MPVELLLEVTHLVATQVRTPQGGWRTETMATLQATWPDQEINGPALGRNPALVTMTLAIDDDALAAQLKEHGTVAVTLEPRRRAVQPVTTAQRVADLGARMATGTGPSDADPAKSGL